MLGRICRVTSGDGNLPSVTQACTEVLQSFFEAGSVGIWFADGEWLVLNGIALRPGVPAEVAVAVRREYGEVPIESDSIGAVAMRKHGPVQVARGDPELDEGIREILAAIGADHVTAYPMMTDGQAVGVAVVGSVGSPPTEAEERLLRIAVHHLAAVSHSRQRAQLDREMAQRLANLNGAIENLPHPVKILSPDWRILSVNRAVMRLFGYAENELIGSHITKLRSETATRETQPAIEDAIPLGGWHGEILDKHKDGSLIPVYLTTVPVRDAGGRVTSILEFEQDLRIEKEREQKVREAYRLASIGELAASVAHEVNNPLGAIANYAQLLEMEPLPKEVLADLGAIRSEAMRAGAIIRNLLSFARQGVPEKRAVDLANLVETMLTLRKHSFMLAKISIEMHIDEGVPYGWADEQQLQQVLHNLFTNARQAIQQGDDKGVVRVRLRATSGGMAELIVEDSGPGIPPHLGERIFSAFFTTKPAHEGTGLGLSVSRAILEEHGGQLEAGSWGRPRTEGGAAGEGGARFIVRLPAAHDGAALANREEPEGLVEPIRAPGPRPRILVVEDEPALAESVRRFLDRSGYEASIALRAETAVEVLESGERFAVILTDLKMPGMGGEALYERLARDWPEMLNTLIFTSGDVVTPATHEFLSASGRPILQKPYPLQRLRELVEETVGTA